MKRAMNTNANRQIKELSSKLYSIDLSLFVGKKKGLYSLKHKQ